MTVHCIIPSTLYSLKISIIKCKNTFLKKGKLSHQDSLVISSSQNLENTMLTPDNIYTSLTIFLFIKIKYETSNILVNSLSFHYFFLDISVGFSRKVKFLAGWLRWLGTLLCTERLPVWLPVGAHVKVSGGVVVGGSQSMLSSHIDVSLFSLSLSLKIIKPKKRKKKRSKGWMIISSLGIQKL